MDPIDNLGFVPGQNLSVERFDSAEIAAAEQLLQQYLQDNFPTLNLGTNASLFDLNIRPRAVAYMLSRAEWEALRSTQSLKGVLDRPDLASDAIVDAILSNSLVTRRVGTKATGKVRIDVTTSGSYMVPDTTVFKTPEGL